jgi:hypothetical protein
MKVENLYLLAVAAVIVVVIAVAFSLNHSSKKYTVVTEHGSYHTDKFRVCGRGIAFDTNNKKVIVLGNFNIISNLEQ